MLVGGTIACIFVSLLLFLFSYLIWSKKQLTLIAGYNENKFKGDKDKLAKAVGLFLIIIGLLTLILPITVEKIGSEGGNIIMSIMGVGMIGLIVYINSINKK